MDPATLKALGPLAGGLFGLVDDLFTTEEERASARLKVMELMAKQDLGQMGVNAKEAEHKSMFVAGWRPAVGWICAGALAWQYLLMPIFVAVISTISAFTGVDVSFDNLLQFDMATLMPVLGGMLGLGAMRSYEKSKGVHSNNMGS